MRETGKAVNGTCGAPASSRIHRFCPLPDHPRGSMPSVPVQDVDGRIQSGHGGAGVIPGPLERSPGSITTASQEKVLGVTLHSAASEGLGSGLSLCSPRKDRRGPAQCSHFVLDSCCKLSYIVAQPGPDEGRAREASQCGSRHGPAAGLAPLPQEARHGLRLRCPPKRTVREEASRLFTFTTDHRAGLPNAPPSILTTGSQLRLRAHRCWAGLRALA